MTDQPGPGNAQENTSPNSLPYAVDAEDRPYRPADDREVVYFEGPALLRGHLGKLAVAGLSSVILCALSLICWILGWPVSFWVSISLFVIGVLAVPVQVFIIRCTRYRVGNYRIDCERGVLSKRLDTLELWHVDDVQLRQSLMERLLRVGTIRVISNDQTTPELVMRGLPRPRELFESLKQRIIAVKRQRGVIKMDIG